MEKKEQKPFSDPERMRRGMARIPKGLRIRLTDPDDPNKGWQSKPPKTQPEEFLTEEERHGDFLFGEPPDGDPL